MEGTPVIQSSGTGEKVMMVAVGLLLGVAGTALWYQRRMKAIAAKAKASGQDAGYIQAHENFEKLLIYAQNNRWQPIDVYQTITAEE